MGRCYLATFWPLFKFEFCRLNTFFLSIVGQERPLRDRTHPSDPVNSILPPGAQAYDNNFGLGRQINDAHSNLTDQL